MTTDRYSTGDLALAALFAALTAVGALFAIPFLGPVPFTLQVFFVLLAGLVLGPRLAAMSMAAYVCVGLFAPVYAGGASGLGALLGPTGGYIVGFVVAAVLVGYLAERIPQTRLVGLTAVAATGLVPIYGLGALWLAVSLKTTSWEIIVWGGVLQFLPMDLFKAFVAALAFRALVATPVRLPMTAIRAGRFPSRSVV